MVKRITITYGGIPYTVADTDVDELKTHIQGAHTSGSPRWLRVNHGEGSYRETDLLIAPGISVAIAAIDAD